MNEQRNSSQLVRFEDACRSRGPARDVPPEVKRHVYDRYGIREHKPSDYEVDHLISLELGGSNDLKNLRPEPTKAREPAKFESSLYVAVMSKVPMLVNVTGQNALPEDSTG